MNPHVLWLFVAGLVSYRVTRLVVTDSLIEGQRARLKRWAYEDDETSYRLVEWVPPRGGARTIALLTNARGKLADLLICPFCFGVWVSVAVTLLLTAFGVFPGGRWLLIWPAATAGIQALLSSVDGRLNKLDEK